MAIRLTNYILFKSFHQKHCKRPDILNELQYKLILVKHFLG